MVCDVVISFGWVYRRIFDDLSHVKDAGDSDVHAIAKSEGCMVTQRGLGVQVTLQQPIVDPNIASGVQGLQPFHVTQVGLPTNQAGMIYHQSPQQVSQSVNQTKRLMHENALANRHFCLLE